MASDLCYDLNPAMATQPIVACKIVFGPFEYDEPSGKFSKHGTRLRLPGKPLQVLALLVNRSGQIVTREELQYHLWKGTTFVDFEQGLNSAVNKLRQMLGIPQTSRGTWRHSRDGDIDSSLRFSEFPRERFSNWPARRS